jgi:hypothetical protein
MELSFEDSELALAACLVAAQQTEAQAAAQLGPEGRRKLLSKANRFRALADRLAQVKRTDTAT